MFVEEEKTVEHTKPSHTYNATLVYGLSYIFEIYFNGISFQEWVNLLQQNSIFSPTDPSDFQKSERCSRFTWLFMPQSTMG